MKFNNNKERALSIEITPLIDIVFLLVIFFVVTSKIETNQYLTLDLPESESFRLALSNNSQNIILLESGVLIINNQEFSL
jgi:biopolymer transport protein ExbD